jgi:pSer/pThr/pTyr-binding forkhead associated (FHA) protein
VVLDDKSISRRHAYIERRGPGWGVVDQGSANGTFVNGEQIVDAVLFDGQELRLGMVPLRVAIESDTPGTMMMESAPAGGTMLLPNAGGGMGAPPAWGAPPPPPPPPAYGQPQAAYGAGAQAAYAPQPGYAAPAPGPKEEAAALLGIHPSSSAQQVNARYEELAADLNARLETARTPHLKQTYQRNLDEIRRACDILAPGMLVGVVEADLPSAQPSVDPGQVDMEIPAAIRVAIAPIPEAEKKSGAPALPTTILSFLAMFLVATCAYFKLSMSKMNKEFKRFEASQEVRQAVIDQEKYATIDTLEKNGALKNGTFKLCNKGSQPVEILWLGIIYSEIPKEGGYLVKTFNSAYCAKGELPTVVAPGQELTPQVQGVDGRCRLKGEGLFYGMALKDPKNPDTAFRTAGVFNGQTECIPVGVGW